MNALHIIGALVLAALVAYDLIRTWREANQ